MDNISGTQSSHFLNLPAELRISIYGHLLEDNLRYELDVLSYKQLLPRPAITQVNRQIRSESIQLYEDAKIACGKNHRWVFSVDSRFSNKSHRESVRRQCFDIPSWASIRNLSVLFEFPVTPLGARQSIEYELGINAGLLVCKLATKASPVSRYRTHVLESAVRLAILQMATRRRLPKLADHDSECVDVRSCLWPVFDIFNEIPFFSSLEFWEY